MVTYAQLYSTRNSDLLHEARLTTARCAREKGIRETARIYGVSRNTVRLRERRNDADRHCRLVDQRAQHAQYRGIIYILALVYFALKTYTAPIYCSVCMNDV